jgi:hypothetical protein
VAIRSHKAWGPDDYRRNADGWTVRFVARGCDLVDTPSGDESVAGSSRVVDESAALARDTPSAEGKGASMQTPRWFYFVLGASAVLIALSLGGLTVHTLAATPSMVTRAAPIPRWERLSDFAILETATGRVCYVSTSDPGVDCSSVPPASYPSASGSPDR